MSYRERVIVVALLGFVAYGCASTSQAPQPQKIEALRGVASWYGQEFAGRTTANGEIFDPMLMTAAHRTLPFGTIVDVKNAKTGQTVRVRINDRGPYVNNRLIDLTYAAAQQIALVEPGSGEVELNIVRMGRGDREPPAPYVVSVPDVAPVGPIAANGTTSSSMAPAPAPQPAAAPVVVDQVQVVEQHATPQGGVVETRRQVSPDGRTVETVPVGASSATAMTPAPQPAPMPVAVTPAPQPRTLPADRGSAAQLDRARVQAQQQPQPKPAPAPATAANGKYLVQVGAFAQEPNAKALQDKLTKIGQQSFVQHPSALYLVRIGPFATREQAISARERLEAAGISAIIVTNQ